MSFFFHLNSLFYMRIIFAAFLVALVAANLIVKHFGAYGLLFSSFLLIPFDFILRCLIHERYSGKQLLTVLFSLTFLAAAVTIAVNIRALNIAVASVAGFVFAQIGAGAFYQIHKKNKSYFFKVNLSDLIAITFDSIAFQLIAFHLFSPVVTFGQITIKFAGGLLWYYLIFKKFKLHERVIRN